MTKPKGWPRYMVERRLADGSVAYFWYPTGRDRKAGCAIVGRSLGPDYAQARAIADELNRSLDQWRLGTGGVKQIRKFGSVQWWLHVYETRTQAFKKLSDRSKEEYRRHIRIVCDLPLEKSLKGMCVLGDLPVTSISPRAVDRLYERLKVNAQGERRLRQAHFELDILKKAWSTVQRLHPEHFPAGNPFVGLEREARPKRERKTKVPATVEQAYALAEALAEMGHPHLGAAALICFEWLQRPENLLSGAITWGQYRPGVSVRIEHWKNAKDVDHILHDDGVPLYPELEAYLARVPKVGTPIVLWAGAPGGARKYTFRHAHSVVAKARKRAGLPDHVTLAACRHGGITELGDASVTEAEGMAMSAHSTPDAFRLYVKETEAQRRSATRKRRAWRAGKGGS